MPRTRPLQRRFHPGEGLDLHGVEHPAQLVDQPHRLRTRSTIGTANVENLIDQPMQPDTIRVGTASLTTRVLKAGLAARPITVVVSDTTIIEHAYESIGRE
jgi:hypothetical protein